MTPDRRLTPANARVADPALRDSWPGVEYVEPQPFSVHWPLVDLMNVPEGHRERQLLFGDGVDVYEVHKGWAFVRAIKDGYVGYVPNSALAQCPAPSHRVTAASSHIYRRPDIKSMDSVRLSHGCLLHVIGEENGFAQTADGYVPLQHLGSVQDMQRDPVTEAELYLDTPYLWGGNSRFGIDCSGLVQASLLACGIACPADSDLQESDVGEALGADDPHKRGDLIFWKGHVAMVVDAQRMIHANAHAMATCYEDIDAAIARIEHQGGGPVTSRKRFLEDRNE
ncbi:MAG: C40 family peptidase [Cognatishimia sp.]|nr:C40 family peptidase [Cognatishimia sp.]